jgi:hypothetical protein
VGVGERFAFGLTSDAPEGTVLDLLAMLLDCEEREESSCQCCFYEAVSSSSSSMQ